MDPALRRVIVERAGHRCEYCQLHRDHQPSVPFHLEHIIARQHGGDDSPANLALACHRCNLCKGPNLTGLDPETGELTRLFHPRQDRWTAHFAFQRGQIVGLTVIGRTTAALLQMNTPDRIELRLALLASGLWDSALTNP
jgi:HNH endonuclease